MLLTPEDAAAILKKAGAGKVAVVEKDTLRKEGGLIVGRGRMMLAFFEIGRSRQAWVIRGDAWLRNFERDVARELGSEQPKAA